MALRQGVVRAAFWGLCWSLGLVPLHAQSQTPIPSQTLEGAWPLGTVIRIGAPEIVVDAVRQHCETIDIPDAPARALRDQHNTVHLFASHYVARALVGASLDRVQPDCRVRYRSPENPDPAQFQDRNWLSAFYTEDGVHITALVHSEYQARRFAGQCDTPTQGATCWWNSITMAESDDGGLHFVVPAAPGNRVATLPYRYERQPQQTAYGYHSPSNIVQRDGYFYALINAWPYRAQRYGPCLMRTPNLSDHAGWRAWDGKDFTLPFADPYRDTIANPAQHVCQPVFAGEVDSLSWHAPSQRYIATQYTADGRFGPPGLYFSSSADLLHWSQPLLVVRTDDLLRDEPAGSWSYIYFSLLDGASPDRNFTTLSNQFYVYYVRLDRLHPPYARALVRRPLRWEPGLSASSSK